MILLLIIIIVIVVIMMIIIIMINVITYIFLLFSTLLFSSSLSHRHIYITRSLSSPPQSLLITLSASIPHILWCLPPTHHLPCLLYRSHSWHLPPSLLPFLPNESAVLTSSLPSLSFLHFFFPLHVFVLPLCWYEEKKSYHCVEYLIM